MLKHYKEKGLFSETKMWESIECLDDILEEMKEKLTVALARGSCKNVTRQEVHQLIDEIFDEYI